MLNCAQPLDIAFVFFLASAGVPNRIGRLSDSAAALSLRSLPESSKMTRTFLAAFAFFSFLLAACGGGGSEGTTPLPPASTVGTAVVPSAGSTMLTATPAVLTLAEYKANRRPVSIAPSAKDVDLARALAIRLTVPTETKGSGTLFSATLDVARLRVIHAAASGDTVKELAALSPDGSLGAPGAVLTSTLQRQLLIRPGTKLTLDFWTATEQPANRSTVDSWSARELELEGNHDIPYALFSSIDQAYERRLAVQDRVAVDLPWPAATTARVLFTDESSARYLVDALRINAPIATLTTDAYRAEALAVDGWTVLKVTPGAGTLTDFGPDRLAAALKASTDALHGTLAKPMMGDLLLLPQSVAFGSDRSNVNIPETSLVFSAEKANLAMDAAGGQFATVMQPSMNFNIDQSGLKLGGAAWLGFAFNPKNIYANTHYGSYSNGLLPWSDSPFCIGCAQPPLCPSDSPSLRSFFLALLDVRGVLQALTWVQTVSKAADCR